MRSLESPIERGYLTKMFINNIKTIIKSHTSSRVNSPEVNIDDDINAGSEHITITYQEIETLIENMYMSSLQALNVRMDVAVENDIQQLKGAVRMCPKRIKQLRESKPGKAKNEIINKSKSLFIQVYSISKRHPEILNVNIINSFESLLYEVIRHEAKQLEILSNEYEVSFSSIEKFFHDAYNNKQIWNISIKELFNSYCRDHGINLPLQARFHKKGFITVFIDETTKREKITGNKHFISNYSYLIVDGNLSSETKVNKSNLINSGIGYAHCEEKTSESTLEGIFYVLSWLSFEYGFVGHVKIVIDNEGAKAKFDRVYRNAAICNCFSRIDIAVVRRNKNKKADKILRKNVVINLSDKEYKHLISIQ